MIEENKTWVITVAGYGSFEFVGTEVEAEEMRRHIQEASWEGGVVTKEGKNEY